MVQFFRFRRSFRFEHATTSCKKEMFQVVCNTYEKFLAVRFRFHGLFRFDHIVLFTSVPSSELCIICRRLLWNHVLDSIGHLVLKEYIPKPNLVNVPGCI